MLLSCSSAFSFGNFPQVIACLQLVKLMIWDAGDGSNPVYQKIIRNNLMAHGLILWEHTYILFDTRFTMYQNKDLAWTCLGHLPAKNTVVYALKPEVVQFEPQPLIKSRDSFSSQMSLTMDIMSQQSTSKVVLASAGYIQIKARTKGLEANMLEMEIDAIVTASIITCGSNM